MQQNFPVTTPTPAVPAVFLFEGHEVRSIEIDGEPWFVAKDVCDVISISNASNAFSRVDDDDRGIHLVDDATGRSNNMIIVNESGMYTLILRSDKPEAKRFKRWVTKDVLPSIRKHGHYSVAPVANPATQPVISKDPLDLFLITSNAIQQIKAETDARIANVEDEIQDMKNSQPVLNHQRYSIQKAVGEKVQQLSEKHQIAYRPVLFSSVYGFIKRYFRVPTYSAIPSIRFEEALTIIKNLVLEQLPENVIAMAKGGAA